MGAELLALSIEGSKFLEKFFLPPAQFGGHFDQDLDMLVAFSEAVHMGNTLAAQREDLASLRTGGDGYFLGSVEGRNFKLRS